MNDDLRALFPITKDAVYLNHAAVSPPPLPTVAAVTAQLNNVVEHGLLHYRWDPLESTCRHASLSIL